VSIPIIGQPKVGEWFFTMLVTCSCGQSILITGQPGPSSVKACECGKAYALLGLPTLSEGGVINFPLGCRS
jgi:hypothetical protein